MHRAQRVDLMSQLGHVHVREFRGSAGGDVARCLPDVDEGSSQHTREQPGDAPGGEQHG